MYSQNVSEENQKLNAKKGEYKEINSIQLKKPIILKDPAGNNSSNRKLKKK